MKCVRSLLSSLVICLLFAAYFCPPAYAQDPDDDEVDYDARTARLNYSFDEQGVAQVTFHCAGKESLSTEQKQRLAQALELTLKEHKSTYESDEEEESGTSSPPEQYVYYSARGKKSFALQNGKVTGELQLASLITALQAAGYQELYLLISHPELGFAEFPKLAQTDAHRALTMDYGFHPYRISLAQPQLQTLSFAFGELSGVRWSRDLPLLGMLVVPLLLTWWSSWSKLRKHRQAPGSVTIVSPGLLILLGHCLPMLWWVTVYLTKVDRAFKPWLQARSEWLSTCASIALYVAPPLLVVLLCQAIHQYTVGHIKGAENSFGQLLKQTALQIVTTIVPSLLFIYGMYAIVTLQGRKGLTYFALGFVLSGLASKWQWKALGLTPYIVPPGSLRNRIFALAQQAGVKLREAFLIADTNGRTVNAFASSGDNILLTEYLLSQFSRREMDFILSHELAHLQRKHIQKNVWLSVLTVPVLVFMNSFLGGFVMTFLTLLGSVFPALYRYGLSWYLPLTVALSLTLIVLVKMFLSRRFEYEADAGGVALTNDPEAAITALVKLGKLNLEPMDGGKLNGKLLTHPAVKQRVQAIARAYRITSEQLEQLMTRLDADPARYAAHTETNDALKALPPASEPPPTQLPQNGEARLWLTLATWAAAGMLLTWLLLTPGYAPHNVLKQMHVPTWAVIASVGGLIAVWFCRHLKKAILKTMSQHQEFLPVEILDCPAITTATEMNTILAYTSELESLGFKYVTDYTLVQQSLMPLASFARLFLHPEHHCYAEIGHMTGSTLDKKKTWCSFFSSLTDDLALGTTNQKPDAINYANRLANYCWSCHLDSSATDLLEIHLERRARLQQQSQQRVQTELAREAYFDAQRQMATLRRENFQRHSMLQFMYELDAFKRAPKTEWWGRFAVARTTETVASKSVLTARREAG
jgi:Zn-dependent protease with chaperone function